MAGRVLALDLATVTGWAVAEPGAPPAPTPLEMRGVAVTKPRAGTQRIGIKGAGIGSFGVALRTWLLDMIAVHAPEMVVFEAPYVGGITSQDTARKLMGMAFMVEAICSERGVACMEANVAQVRKHFVSRGSGPRGSMKMLVIERCRALGWAVADDNEADALALLDYALSCLRPGRAA